MKKKPRLLNKKFYRVDKSGKSIAVFFKNSRPIVDNKMIKELKSISSLNRKTMRICLHYHIKDNLQDMIIIDFKNNKPLPHFHYNTDETHHIIEGKLCCFLFDKNGRIKSKCILSKFNNIIDVVDRNECHMVFPITNKVIHHETHNGPFNRKNRDMNIPKWFLKLSEKQKIKFYKKLNQLVSK